MTSMLTDLVALVLHGFHGGPALGVGVVLLARFQGQAEVIVTPHHVDAAQVDGTARPLARAPQRGAQRPASLRWVEALHCHRAKMVKKRAIRDSYLVSLANTQCM